MNTPQEIAQARRDFGSGAMGRLEGDEVVCGYHGLVYNAEGRCTHMPSQETINPSACVRAYPVVEKHRFVWVWPGDPALADPALYGKDPDKFARISKSLDLARAEKDAAEERWLEVQSDLEAIGEP